MEQTINTVYYGIVSLYCTVPVLVATKCRLELSSAILLHYIKSSHAKNMEKSWKKRRHVVAI
jgi:hypothetical protein